jgi:hypothetical protein
LSDCNFNSSAGEVSGTQASRYIGTVSTYLNHIRIFLFFTCWAKGEGMIYQYINLSCFHVGRMSLLYIRTPEWNSVVIKYRVRNI